jgi:RNA polymerase sigma factor (sigma-70 family)
MPARHASLAPPKLIAETKVGSYVGSPTETRVTPAPSRSPRAKGALMAVPVPSELTHLLDHLAPSARDEAWTAFVQSHSKLILYVARSLGGDHDDVMDRYACVLEKLRRDDFHRLRGYGADGRGKFTTWLVVVVRRMCLDLQREKYGRVRSDDHISGDGHRMRGRLVDLVSNGTEITELVDNSTGGPEDRLRAIQLDDALKSAVAALEPNERLLLRLRFEDDLTAPDIARLMLWRSQFDVYRQLRKVLNTLRMALVRHGVADSAP